MAQRQKALLAGVGATALGGGAAFLFSGDDDRHADASGDTVSIDTGGLVNRNLSEREFVATYGNRADAQDREIKALKEGQVSRPELEQQQIGRAPSELQSLMRISYAVFCLKQKKISKLKNNNTR